MKPPRVVVAGLLVFLSALSPAAQADDREHWLRNMVIESGETVDDALCIFCSVRVRGQVTGDVVTIGGSVYIEPGAVVSSDVVAVGGGIHLGPGVVLNDDAVAIGGPVETATGAQVKGEIVSYPYFVVPGQRRVYLRGAAAFLAASVVASLLAFSVLRRRRTTNIAGSLRARPWLTLLTGLGALAVILVLYELPAILKRWEEIESWWLGVTALFLLIFLPGYAGLSLHLGSLRHGGRPALAERAIWQAIVLGAVAASVVMMIPLAGLIGACAVFSAATGSAILSGFGGRAAKKTLEASSRE